MVFLAIEVRAERPPNVVLILADDMALGDLASLNGGRSRTPHLDQLKSESLWFRHACSASPVCAPARAALLTGRYPHRTGVVSLNMEKHPEFTRLKRDEQTLADLFRAKGYVTGLVGKWHLGTGQDFHPLARGFDQFEGFIGHLYVPSYHSFKLDVQGETRDFSDRYLTEELSRRAVAFIERHRDEPFFLHLAHYAPHRPIEAPADRVAPYLEAGLDEETATVYAMIEMMDEGIGSLLSTLDRLKLRERTLVVFASDNGPDPLVASRFNAGLRGSKYEVYEGGIRVPFFWHWKGHIEPAQSEVLVNFLDVLPTLAEVCGLDRSNKLPLDGRSFASLLRGDSPPESRAHFWQWNRGAPRYSHNAAIREGQWKLVRPFVTKNYPKGPSDRQPVLFDLIADPDETDDVAAQHTDRVSSMNAELERWMAAVERDRTR